MNYYYDVSLNFQDNFYMFYEWDEYDTIEYFKKVPLFHVDTKILSHSISKIIKVDKELLNIIENKTKLKQNKFLKYTCILSDGKNSIALEFNDDGLVINKSSLTVEDELNINEFVYSISKSKINYEIIKDDTFFKETRQELKIKKVLKLEIDSMYKQKNHAKLKYIYLEWFDEILDNIDTMYNNMLDKINDKLTEKEYHIYELIKISYNNV